jgi:hypothetical protein
MSKTSFFTRNKAFSGLPRPLAGKFPRIVPRGPRTISKKARPSFNVMTPPLPPSSRTAIAFRAHRTETLSFPGQGLQQPAVAARDGLTEHNREIVTGSSRCESRVPGD